MSWQEYCCHHRHIGERENQRTDDAEYQGLGHRGEIFALYAAECQQWEKHDEYDEHGKGRTAHHLGCTLLHLIVHLFGIELLACQTFGVDVGQYAFDDHYGAVNHDTKVNGTKTHQIGRHTKDAHQDEAKEHGQGNDRGNNHAGTDIAQEQHQHHEHDDGSLDQIVYHRRDVAVDQF